MNIFKAPQQKINPCPHCGENKSLQFYKKHYDAQLGISSTYHSMKCWTYKKSFFKKPKKESSIIDYTEYHCHTCGMTWQEQNYISDN